MQEMPRYSLESVSSFKNIWEQWNETASFFYAEGNLSTLSVPQEDYSEFVQIFGILAGNENIIIECSSTWKEALVSLLFFTNPTCDSQNLHQLLEKVKKHFETNLILDQIHLSILERNVPHIIKHCSEFDWYT